jgi:hypothetical protein
LKMIKHLFNFMRYCNLFNYKLILRSRIGYNLVVFIRESARYRLKPLTIFTKYIIAHNGVRAKHVRRV